MRMSIGMLRQIINEEVTKIHRKRLYENDKPPSIGPEGSTFFKETENFEVWHLEPRGAFGENFKPAKSFVKQKSTGEVIFETEHQLAPCHPDAAKKKSKSFSTAVYFVVNTSDRDFPDNEVEAKDLLDLHAADGDFRDPNLRGNDHHHH